MFVKKKKYVKIYNVMSYFGGNMKGLKYYIKDSIKNHYAIGAYNFVDMEMLKGICEGAKMTNSPTIVAVSEGAFKYMDENFLLGLYKSAKKSYTGIPLFLHLDHGKSFEICKKAVDLKFNSVMIDGSSLSFEENVLITKKVVKYAHAHGVLVEAELGVLKGVEDNVSANKNIYTDPLKAKEFVEKTNCDTLAVAIGTSHGAYKFSDEANLRFDILSEIENLLPNFPLVLHGASSVPQKYVEKINKFGGNVKGAKGVDESLLAKACREHNVCKINSDTDLRMAYISTIREHLKEHPDNIDLRKFNTLAIEEIKQLVAEKNRCFNNIDRI